MTDIKKEARKELNNCTSMTIAEIFEAGALWMLDNMRYAFKDLQGYFDKAMENDDWDYMEEGLDCFESEMDDYHKP